MDLSGPKQRFGRVARQYALPLALLAIIALSALGTATAVPGAFPLQLEVFVNGHPTGLVGTFEYSTDKRMRAKAGDLHDLGIATGETDRTRWLDLAKIPGLTYNYDEANQTIALRADETRLVRKEYAARPQDDELPEIDTSTGALLNYSLVGLYQRQDSALDFASGTSSGGGINAQLDGRIFGPYGTFSNSLLAGTNLANEQTLTRLETAWSWSDPKNLVTWRAGDTISGGLDWTRPVRLGGVQYQRNFRLRPSLITTPLPEVTGSAAVPSTVDVYINNTKTFSRKVNAGPFRVTELPALTGAGTARVVLRDATGRTSETTAQLYGSTQLLRKGLYDFSTEAGVARRNLGTKSNDYDDKIAALGTLRYGFTDDFTGEVHAEIQPALFNAGAGFVTRLGTFGIASLAASASTFHGAFGAQIYAALQTEVWGLTISASTRRAFGTYADLVTSTAATVEIPDAATSRFTFSPTRSLDLISVGIPLYQFGASLNLSFVNSETEEEAVSRTITGSLSKRLTKNASVYATGFHDIEDGGTGIFAGITVALGDRTSASLGVTTNSGETRFSGSYTRSAGHTPGSYGYRLSANRGNVDTWQASVTYQAERARLRGTVERYGENTRGTIVADGAVAVAGGGVFLTNRVDDAFAVVDAGAPGVEVSYENRPVGTTNKDGLLLVPGLRSYEKNKITIDPKNLPIDAEIETTEQTVVPADRHGVKVKLNIKQQSQSALVSFRGPGGAFIAAGQPGVVIATGEEFVVGYDGQAFIKTLSNSNTVRIGAPATACTASFTYKPAPGSQVVIEDVPCR